MDRDRDSDAETDMGTGAGTGTGVGIPPGVAAADPDPTGVLDEALEQLHAAGPERLGRLTNHAPMAVEALAARGLAGSVHRWVDRYAPRLEDFPAPVAPVTAANWHEALGEPRRAADWIGFFARELAARPWRDVLAEWWPRLLPGLYGGSTHPVIRVGHAVRTLLASDPTAPRLAELGHGLGYWAARHRPVAEPAPLPGAAAAADALAAVPPIDRQDGGFPDRLARVDRLPVWAAAAGATAPEEAYGHLTALVKAATHRYASHGHGDETMLVHAATAPNAVLRALPALPRALWVPSLRAAWTASAAVTAMYSPTTGIEPAPAADGLTGEEVFALALAHGDEHVIKFTDTALDFPDPRSLAAALRAIELSTPLT
ncbi:questin oxidase family protein [Streptomyces sp. NPDC090025]|uniref:questin oxidase family protein n=1 Tax=Streptomyces sp. NPDC090025 TaxID=3365922 RepID=UPI0038360FDF